MVRKVLFRSFIIIALFIIGFIFLLRSCLAKFDERFVISKPEVIEQNGNTVIFSIIESDKVNSYRRRGGIINKSVSVSYYVQTNNGKSAEKIKELKIKKPGEIKSYPIEMLGVTENKSVWLFAGELLAYNPFTLEKKADLKMIEKNNPVVKGKLLYERKYYEFENGNIRLTTADGINYILSPHNLLLTIYDESSKTGTDEKKLISLDKMTSALREQNNLLYDRFREINKQYATAKLSLNLYKDSIAVFEKEKTILRQKQDSINKIIDSIKKSKEHGRDLQYQIKQLKNRPGFSSMQYKNDTLNGNWYGLFDSRGIEKQTGIFYYASQSAETDRNKFYSTFMKQRKPASEEWIIGDKMEAKSNDVYLQGGFLLNTETALPIHLNGPDGYIIVCKNQLGNEGVVLLSRVDLKGKQLWQSNTGLKAFDSWKITDTHLYIFGTDNKELNPGQINNYSIIDLSNGKLTVHDFYKGKNR